MSTYYFLVCYDCQESCNEKETLLAFIIAHGNCKHNAIVNQTEYFDMSYEFKIWTADNIEAMIAKAKSEDRWQ